MIGRVADLAKLEELRGLHHTYAVTIKSPENLSGLFIVNDIKPIYAAAVQRL